MWSNDAVDDHPDEHPDGASPWMRDDWLPDSAVPDAAVFGSGARRSDSAGRASESDGPHEPPPEDFDDSRAGGATPRSSTGRKAVAGAIVIALLVGSAGALLRCEGEADVEPAADPGSLLGDQAAPTTVADTIPPTSARAVTSETSAEPGPSVGPADRIPSPVVGEPPVWAERTIAVPDALASVAPTEVVTLSQSRILNVTEFPTGRTRSIDVTELGPQAELAVGDGTIVVFNDSTLLQIRDGQPILESTLSDGVIFVQPWSGTGSFVVTTPRMTRDAPEQNWVLRPDGTLELLESPFIDETSFFSRRFSPEGDAIVTAPGGVYAVDPAGGSRRISSGVLLATGSRHWAIEECDESLRCAYSIVEWDTGTVTPGVLDVLDNFGFIDPATVISPDGRSVAYRADTDGTGRRRILDVATGSSLEAGRVNQFVYPDSWASDSSGLFFADRLLQFVDRSTGAISAIDDLDTIRSVAIGRFAA